MVTEKKVYIVLVNFNQWSDTIECIESVLKSNYPNYQIVVVDNHSSNDSIQHLADWAAGKETVTFSTPPELSHLTQPQSVKPIRYLIYTEEEALKGGNPQAESAAENQSSPTRYPLIFIQSNSNKGFAAGCNIGMKYALNKKDMDYVWLLNNDTVTDEHALTALTNRFEETQNRNQKTGLVGSKILFYDKPKVLQAVGGMYNLNTTLFYHLGTGEPDNGQFDRNDISIDYPMGCSTLCSRFFLEEAGLLEEKYFMYYEELDWAVRARKKNLKITYAYRSKVYHKQGATTGEKMLMKHLPPMVACYQYRNMLLFYKKFYPVLLPVAYLRLAFKVIKNFFNGNQNESFLIARIILGKRNCKTERKNNG